MRLDHVSVYFNDLNSSWRQASQFGSHIASEPRIQTNQLDPGLTSSLAYRWIISSIIGRQLRQGCLISSAPDSSMIELGSDFTNKSRRPPQAMADLISSPFLFFMVLGVTVAPLPRSFHKDQHSHSFCEVIIRTYSVSTQR